MMKKFSGPQIFMYIVIAVCVGISALSFFGYYRNGKENPSLLWMGIVAFMIVYHLWGRILLGNVTKLFRVREDMWWFREKPFEKKLYQTLQVKRWKGKALTYNPDHFSLEKRSIGEVVGATLKAELDHWVNEGISLVSILFSLLWGEVWIFVLTALFAMLFDGQFILIQRYNRPRLLRLLGRKNLQSSVASGDAPCYNKE